ncbi:MAG TPA: VOC family protein [Rhizomicrobium sp.]|jgi:catechol 2,3-dioxygenase-like lactoylglutathione lyase family enzyme
MSSQWRLKHLYHTIVNAKDIDESVAFYEMLGFEIISDRRDADWPKGGGVSFGLVPDTKGRGVLMVLPGDPGGPMMDIIEWIEPKAAFAEPSPRTIPRVIAFRTENVRQAHKELKAKGVTFTTEEPTSIPQAGIVACAVARDPNGNLIEMIELEPGLRHSRIGEVFSTSAGKAQS